MSAVDELIAKIREETLLCDVGAGLIRAAFASGGPCLTREQVVEVCKVLRGAHAESEKSARSRPYLWGGLDCGETIIDAFRSGEEPR